MSINQQSQYQSTDKFIEDYQKRLKELQILSKSNLGDVQDYSTFSEPAPKPEKISTGINSQFHLLRHDFQESFKRLEQQFSKQLAEYKELRKQVDLSKKELALIGDITVGSRELKLLNETLLAKKALYEEEVIAHQKKLAQQLEQYENQTGYLVDMRKDELAQVELDFKVRLDMARVTGEQSQLRTYESFQFLMLEEEKNLDNKKELALDEHAQRLKALEQDIVDRKNAVDSDFLSFSDDREKDRQQLIREFEEKKICVDADFKQFCQIIQEERQQLEKDLSAKKARSTQLMLEFSEQLKQKRYIWEQEKVSVVESIDKDQFVWQQQKEILVQEYEATIQDLDIKKEVFSQFKDNEQKRLKEVESELIRGLDKKQAEFDIQFSDKQRELKGILDHIHRSKTALLELDQTVEEKNAAFSEQLELLEESVSIQKKKNDDRLSFEYQEQKTAFLHKMKRLEEKQSEELADKLASFEEQLSKRRELFDEELLHRRQAIIEACKKEQQIEFDHILEFERDKLNKEVVGKEQENQALQVSLAEQRASFSEEKTMLNTQITELMSTQKDLKQSLEEVAFSTREKTMATYEDKYKQVLDSFKSRSKTDLQQVQRVNAQLEEQLKKNELSLKEYQLKIKRLEGQLNHYMVQEKRPDPQPVKDDGKILRLRKRFPGSGQ